VEDILGIDVLELEMRIIEGLLREILERRVDLAV